MTPDELAERLRAAGHSVSLAGNVSKEAAAEFLEVSTRKLEVWRAQRKGPTYLMIARTVRYPLHALLEYRELCMHKAER